MEIILFNKKKLNQYLIKNIIVYKIIPNIELKYSKEVFLQIMPHITINIANQIEIDERPYMMDINN